VRKFLFKKKIWGNKQKAFILSTSSWVFTRAAFIIYAMSFLSHINGRPKTARAHPFRENLGTAPRRGFNSSLIPDFRVKLVFSAFSFRANLGLSPGNEVLQRLFVK